MTDAEEWWDGLSDQQKNDVWCSMPFPPVPPKQGAVLTKEQIEEAGRELFFRMTDDFGNLRQVGPEAFAQDLLDKLFNKQ